MSDKGQQLDGDPPVVDIGEDINATTILTVGTVTALLILIVVIALVGLFNQTARQEAVEKSAQAGFEERAELSSAQLGRLGSYDWVDRNAKVVCLPIAQAMELTTAKLAAGEQFFALSMPVDPVSDNAGDEMEEVTNDPEE